MGGIYILNQIIDLESDKINKKLYLLPEGYIPVKHAWIELILIFAVVIVLTIPFSTAFKIILIASGLLGILYSLPPFALKNRPFFDLLSNSFGYGVLAFSLGWVTGHPFSPRTLIFSLPYFFAVGAVFVNTAIPDIEGDKRANKITTSVLLGTRNSYLLSTCLLLIALILSIFLKDWVCGVASFCSLPLFIWALLKDDLRACLISIKGGILILVIIAAINFWWFILILLFLFFALRIYYKHRFNIVYPKIT